MRLPGSPSLTGRIRALIVEDSGFMRRVIRKMLVSDPQIEVVGQAADGAEAVRAVATLAPDVVTMDVHMPTVDGLAAVARIMADHPTPIVMVSSETREGSAAAIRALELGAIDFVTKPSGRGVDLGLENLRDELIQKVKMAARIRPVRTPPGRPASMAPVARRYAPPVGRAGWIPCVVLAASTGGPAALLSLIPSLPANLPASLLIVQHMPTPYTAQLAHELDRRSAIRVKEAEAGDVLARGTAYVAPGGRILTVSAEGRALVTPASRAVAGSDAANRTMTSVAEHAGSASLGVVLTGMGKDGAEGAATIRRAGGIVLAQDEGSCLVYGMPRAAVEAGSVDAVVPLSRLSHIMLGSLAVASGTTW